MPLAHAHLQGAHMSSASRHEGSPAGLPRPESQHGMQAEAEQRALCELLGPVPGKPHLTQAPALVGTEENSSLRKKAEQGADPEAGDSSAIYPVELIRFPKGGLVISRE